MSSKLKPDHDAGLLAAADVGSISCSADGVITVAVGYVSLRLERPAFCEFLALLTAAKQRLDLEPLEVVSRHGAALPGLH